MFLGTPQRDTFAQEETGAEEIGGGGQMGGWGRETLNQARGLPLPPEDDESFRGSSHDEQLMTLLTNLDNTDDFESEAMFYDSIDEFVERFLEEHRDRMNPAKYRLIQQYAKRLGRDNSQNRDDYAYGNPRLLSNTKKVLDVLKAEIQSYLKNDAPHQRMSMQPRQSVPGRRSTGFIAQKTILQNEEIKKAMQRTPEYDEMMTRHQEQQEYDVGDPVGEIRFLRAQLEFFATEKVMWVRQSDPDFQSKLDSLEKKMTRLKARKDNLEYQSLHFHHDTQPIERSFGRHEDIGSRTDTRLALRGGGKRKKYEDDEDYSGGEESQESQVEADPEEKAAEAKAAEARDPYHRKLSPFIDAEYGAEHVIGWVSKLEAGEKVEGSDLATGNSPATILQRFGIRAENMKTVFESFSKDTLSFDVGSTLLAMLTYMQLHGFEMDKPIPGGLSTRIAYPDTGMKIEPNMRWYDALEVLMGKGNRLPQEALVPGTRLVDLYLSGRLSSGSSDSTNPARRLIGTPGKGTMRKATLPETKFLTFFGKFLQSQKMGKDAIYSFFQYHGATGMGDDEGAKIKQLREGELGKMLAGKTQQMYRWLQPFYDNLDILDDDFFNQDYEDQADQLINGLGRKNPMRLVGTWYDALTNFFQVSRKEAHDVLRLPIKGASNKAYSDNDITRIWKQVSMRFADLVKAAGSNQRPEERDTGVALGGGLVRPRKVEQSQHDYYRMFEQTKILQGLTMRGRGPTPNPKTKRPKDRNLDAHRSLTRSPSPGRGRSPTEDVHAYASALSEQAREAAQVGNKEYTRIGPLVQGRGRVPGGISGISRVLMEAYDKICVDKKYKSSALRNTYYGQIFGLLERCRNVARSDAKKRGRPAFEFPQFPTGRRGAMKESKEDLYAKMGWNVFLDIMHDNMKEEDYQNHYLKDLPEINSVFDDVASGVKPMFRADQRDHVKDMLMSYCAGTMIKGNHVRVMPREAGSKPAETRGVIKLNQRVSNVDKDTAFLPFSTIDTQERRSVYVAYEKKEKEIGKANFPIPNWRDIIERQHGARFLSGYLRNIKAAPQRSRTRSLSAISSGSSGSSESSSSSDKRPAEAIVGGAAKKAEVLSSPDSPGGEITFSPSPASRRASQVAVKHQLSTVEEYAQQFKKTGKPQFLQEAQRALAQARQSQYLYTDTNLRQEANELEQMLVEVQREVDTTGRRDIMRDTILSDPSAKKHYETLDPTGKIEFIQNQIAQRQTTASAVAAPEDEDDDALLDDLDKQAEAVLLSRFEYPNFAGTKHNFDLRADAVRGGMEYQVNAIHMLQTDHNVAPVMGRVHMVRPAANYSDKHFMVDLHGDINEGQKTVVERSKRGPFRDRGGRSTIMDRSAHIMYRNRRGIFEITIKDGASNQEFDQLLSKLNMHRVHQTGSRVTIIKGSRRYRLGVLSSLDMDYLMELISECLDQYGTCGIEITEEQTGTGPLYRGVVHKPKFRAAARKQKKGAIHVR
jgi:hypothetical protein